jgi:hypothetical protein
VPYRENKIGIPCQLVGTSQLRGPRFATIQKIFLKLYGITLNGFSPGESLESWCSTFPSEEDVRDLRSLLNMLI